MRGPPSAVAPFITGGAHTARASAAARLARYQSRVDLSPTLKSVAGTNPKRSRAREPSHATTGLTVGLGRIPAHLTGESHQIHDDAHQVPDGQFAVGTQVDRVGVVVALGGKQDAFGGVVDVQELA